jgi:hypothetical protein
MKAHKPLVRGEKTSRFLGWNQRIRNFETRGKRGRSFPVVSRTQYLLKRAAKVVVMHQLVGMGEMRRIREMREKIYLNLPHLSHLHSSQKDQLLMTTPGCK